jgi:hypothetical protein
VNYRPFPGPLYQEVLTMLHAEIFIYLPVWKGVAFLPRMELQFLEKLKVLDGEFQGWRNQYGFGLHLGLTVLGFSVRLELDFDRD